MNQKFKNNFKSLHFLINISGSVLRKLKTKIIVANTFAGMQISLK